MKFIKTRLRTKMGDDYLNNHMLIYINKELADSHSLIDVVERWYNSNPNRRAGKLKFSTLVTTRRGLLER